MHCVYQQIHPADPDNCPLTFAFVLNGRSYLTGACELTRQRQVLRDGGEHTGCVNVILFFADGRNADGLLKKLQTGGRLAQCGEVVGNPLQRFGPLPLAAR